MGPPPGRAPLSAVSINGVLVAPERASMPIADPGARWGEGLFESMRARGGVIFRLDHHLDRLERSARALELAPLPGRAEIAEAVRRTVAANPSASQRVRVTVTPHPTLIVEAEAYEPPAGAAESGVAVVSVRGAWNPGKRIAEHKTLSYAAYRLHQRRAEAAGAFQALLLDERGRLGEASMANVFVALGGEIVTAPVAGLLPGVTREAVMEIAGPVREALLEEREWRAAGEMVLTNAIQGIVPVVRCDGRPVGAGAPGPVARRLQAGYAALVAAAAAG
jgi:branched-chain amino acid aminotransferase